MKKLITFLLAILIAQTVFALGNRDNAPDYISGFSWTEISQTEADAIWETYDLTKKIAEYARKEYSQENFMKNLIKVYEESLKKYKGDSSVIVDDKAMIIQVFKILPRFEKHKLLHEHEQYMFSIHIPEKRRGFVKDEKHY